MNQIYKKAFYGILLFLYGQKAVFGMPDVKELDPLNLPETNSRIVHTENINSRLEVPLSFKNETLTGSYGKITVNAGGVVDYVSDSIFNNLAEGGKYSEVFRLSTTDNIKIDLPVNIIGTNDSASISKLEYVIDASQNSLFESASGTLWIKDEDTGQSSFVEIIDLDGVYGKFSLSTKGKWSYLSTSRQSSLLTGESVSDNFTVTSIDGTKRDISIFIKGTKNIEPTVENEESYYEVSESNGLTLRKQLLPDSQKTYAGGLSKVKIKLIQGKRYRFIMRGLNLATISSNGLAKGHSTLNLYMPNDTEQIASSRSAWKRLDPQIIMTPHTSGVHLIECINTNSEFESIGLCELFVEHIGPNKFLNENVTLDSESTGDLAMPMEWENAPEQLEINQVDASTLSGYSCKINKPLQVRNPYDSLIIESYVNTAFKGAINVDEDIDFIKINLNKTKTYFIEVISDYFQPNLSLLDKTGKILETADYVKTIDSLTKTLTLNSAIHGSERVIDSDDEYYLKVNSRFSPGYGEYVIKILEFTGYDENTNLNDITDFVYSPLLLSNLPDIDVVSGVGSQETLNAGDTISGSIEIDSDKDWYKVLLEKNSIYKWELRSVTLNNGMIRLRNSKGELIDHEFAQGWVLQSDSLGDLVYKAKKSGTYYIEILSIADIDPNQKNTATGTYNLIFSKLKDDIGGDFRNLYLYNELSYINDFKDSFWNRKWDNPGRYDLVNLKNAGVLQVGQRLYGNIYEPVTYISTVWGGDYDIYGVDLLTKNTYFFGQYNTSVSPGDINNGDSGMLALLNESGEVLSQWGVEGSSQTRIDYLSYKPERDGYYYLLVSAYGTSRSTDYMIWSDFYGDDFPDTIRTDGNLNFDNAVSGKIDRANDSDWFKVKLKKDDYYEFTYHSGNSTNGTFSLFGPVDTDNGILLNLFNNYESASENWNRFLEQTPFGSGRQVPDIGNTIADSFRIDPFSKLIQYGLTSENIFSSLSSGDKDFYSISLDAAETYQINLIGKKIDSRNYKYDALGSPKLLIYNSLGNILALEANMGVLSAHDGDELRDVEIKFSPPETGDYYFEVSSNQLISNGQKAYAIAINKLPVQRLNYTEIKNTASIKFRAKNNLSYFIAINGDNEASYEINANKIRLPAADSIGESVDNAVSYTVGNEISTQIDYEGDHDWFKVQLDPGETYKIKYKHENTQSEKSSWRDPKDGLLVIRDSFGKVLGALDIWKLINASGGFWGSTQGRYLRTDWANAGESIEFYFSTSLDKQNPSPSKSTHYIDVYSSLAGEMKFSLVKLNDDQKESIATNGLLEVGGSASGTWENGVTNGPNLTHRSGHNYNDGDWFKINLILGNTYKMDIYSDPLTNPNLLLYNEMGLCLHKFGGFWPFPGSDDYGYNSTDALKVETLKDGHTQLTFTADRTGIFFVNAHNRHYRPGNHIYDLSLVHVPDDVASSIETSASLEVDGQANASLESVNDRDWFKVDLKLGSIYRFDVLGNSLKDPTLRIRDSHGRQLYYNDQINGWWNPSINYTAFEDGVYYVDVGGIDSGQYALKCTKLYSPPEGSDVFIGTDLELNEKYLSNSKGTAFNHTIGNIVQGEITQAGDRKWHQFKLEEAHTYEFQLFGDSLQAPILNLRDASGEISFPQPILDKKKTSGDKYVLKYVAPKAGFYYLEVGGYWSSGTGASVKGVPTGTFTLKTSDFGLDSARAVMWEQSFIDAKESAIEQDLGTTVSGAIEHAANRDLYKLFLNEGAIYTFRIDAGLSDGTVDLGVKSRLFLHDQNGALLTAVTGDDLVHKATQSATYYLAVGATTGQEFENKFRENSVVPFSYSIKAVQSRAPKTDPSINWIATLNDSSILNLTIAAMEDGAFSRTEALGILESVKDGAIVDGNELKDLRIIVANYKSAGLSDYIATLLDNIANGDPANQYFTGRDANNNGNTTRKEFGNLYVNSSSDRLDKLITKWFLGADSPAAPYLYVRLDYPLFFNGAGTDDVNQGAVGDCYFLSSISAVADSSVASIDGTVKSVDEGDMIINNGDGTFGVRFYDNSGAQRWVTVDKYVPGYREGKLDFASSDSGESWPMLVEKAYVQLNESDNIGQDGTNRYGIGNNFGIAGGSAGYALSHVTGQKSSYVYLDEDNTTFTSENLREIIDADLPIIFSTAPPCTIPASYGVVCSHTYSIEKFDKLTEKFHLRNAWGFGDAYVTFEALKLMGSQLHYLDGTKTKMERINPDESTFSASDGSVVAGSVYTGLVPVESNGVKLYKDSQNYLYVGDTAQGVQPVTIDGNLVTLTINGRTAIAAESISGVNQILWENDSSGNLQIISFDSSWNFVFSNNSAISSGSDEFNAAKIAFEEGEGTQVSTLAKVTLSGLTQSYDGSAITATVTTDPTGLNVLVIYTDSEGAGVSSPTEVGEYAVLAKVISGNYEGSASGTLSISAAAGSGGSTDSGDTTTTTENFGEPVTYTNIATTLIGQVTIDGVAAREGDVVAFYVGDELRGKQAVVVDAGTAWLNAQVHASGGVETAAIRVYEASTGITHDKVGLSVEIKPEGEAGAFSEPLLIQMDNVAPELTLLGEAQVTIDQGTTYTDAGASATDNVDGDLTSKIVVTGAVDTSTAGTYTLKYDVSDAAGNTAESESRTVSVEKTTVIQTVNLKSGWNLISFYVESEDMAPATVLASIKDNLAQIKDLKSSYNPALPPFLNTLKRLNLKDGYWVSVDADVSFDLEGEVPAGASITVKPGWNLVGYPRENGAAPGTELTSLDGIVEQFKNLKSSYDPALPPFLNTLKVIAPGLGYWLKVSADGKWNVGEVSGGVSNRDISKMGQDESRWGQVVVYPNVSATVLAQVTVGGKAVSSGSVVGAFVGDELRGQHEVVLADGGSYVVINVNLAKSERAIYRIWEATSDKEYGVTNSTTLDMGKLYGTLTGLVRLNGMGTDSGSTIRIVGYDREPFSLEFESQIGWRYVVEATDDLKVWKQVRTLQASSKSTQFTPEPEPSLINHYFRVRVK